MPASRLERFATCGQNGIVQVRIDAEHREYRIVSRHCRDRLCEACQMDRSHLLAKRLSAKAGSQQLRHVTLTVKSSPDLRAQLTELLESFHRLRRRSPWKHNAHGGAYLLEVTLGDPEKPPAWHAHLHVLYVGNYIAQRDLAAAWHAVTPTRSTNVDIRIVPTNGKAVRYLTTYATAKQDSRIFESTDKLAEYTAAIRGRRTASTFGTWRGFELTDLEEQDRIERWENLGPVRRVIADAQDGDPEARRACTALNLDYRAYADLATRPTRKCTARRRAAAKRKPT